MFMAGGFLMTFINIITSICFFICLCSFITEIKAMDQSAYNNNNNNSTTTTQQQQLDDTLQEYAVNSLARRRVQTGVLYNVSNLPSNFTGIEVSIVRLRRDSFWRRGANYSGFTFPPKIFTYRPSANFTRLDLVFSNLRINQSSYYYNHNNLLLPNYTLVAPVIGFNAYGSRNPKGGQIGNFTTKLNLTLFGGPILVHFPNNISSPSAKCVMFYTNGTFEMTNMTLQDMCAVRDQGHFSIAVQAQSSIPVGPTHEKKKNKLWKWWVFGFAVGVIGLVLFGFILFMLIRTFRMKKIRKMEKQAEKNEALEATNVGQSKMPLATLVRTQPVIENDYVP